MSHGILDFQKDVIERSHRVPVVVDFWAAWCAPCRQLGPVIERLAEEAQGRWVLAKVDTELHPDVSERYRVTSIPNVKLFVAGEVVDEFAGAVPEREIRRWLDAALPSPHAPAVAQARTLIEQGGFERAAAALREVLAAEPGYEAARVMLAEALIHVDPDAVAAVLRGIAEDSDLADRAEALQTLARVAALAGHPERLPESAARAHLVGAARAIRAGDYAAALEALIEVLRADRGYADGVAREAGRAIFRLLGLGHPACERHHRAFSSALNI